VPACAPATGRTVVRKGGDRAVACVGRIAGRGCRQREGIRAGQICSARGNNTHINYMFNLKESTVGFDDTTLVR
jgi:hypothetical protein